MLGSYKKSRMLFSNENSIKRFTLYVPFPSNPRTSWRLLKASNSKPPLYLSRFSLSHHHRHHNQRLKNNSFQPPSSSLRIEKRLKISFQHIKMAVARLALKQLQRRLGSASASPLAETRPIGSAQSLLTRSFSTEKDKSDKSSEVTVSEGKKSRLFPRRQRRRWPWRNDDRDFPPALAEFFPSGLGNALMQATDNINRLFESMNITPWSLSGKVKEKDDHYKLRYEMPGIPKEEVKITIDDGVLNIRGEHKEEKAEEEDDEYWSSSSYGFYNTSLVLPDDAKTDQVKAELKDGVLTVTIPRTEKPRKDVKHVSVQ